MAYGAVTRHLVKRNADLEDRIEALEAALAPFVEIADGMFDKSDEEDDPCVSVTIKVESGALLYAQWITRQPVSK